MQYDTQNDISNAFIHNMSLVASPKRSLSKISGYRPHNVSQIESLPQTRVIKPSMLARSVYTGAGRDGQWTTVSEELESGETAIDRQNAMY